MVSKRLHGIIASCKVCVADRDVYVSVTWAAQGDRRARVTSLELLPTLPSSLHLPRARQEMVAGESILSDESAAQLACATLCVLIAWSHSEIIRPVCLRERPSIFSVQQMIVTTELKVCSLAIW